MDVENTIKHKCTDECSHDSDCALHNEPAYPNEPCSCDRKMVIDYLRNEACRDVPDQWNARAVIAKLREVADYLESDD